MENKDESQDLKSERKSVKMALSIDISKEECILEEGRSSFGCE